MAVSFAQLLTPVTEAEAEALLLALLEALGFPASSWKKFRVPRTFVRLFAQLYADSRTGFTNIVQSRLLGYARGDALTYLARHMFDRERAPAIPTEGVLLLTDDGGAPYDFEPGQLVVRVQGNDGIRYTNTNPTVQRLEVGGTLSLAFKAERTGSGHNIQPGTPLEFAETLEGVSVSAEADPGSGTWITTLGADEQSDESLIQACRARWATLGAGTEDAYRAWALEGAPTATKIRVYGSEITEPGIVLVLLANDSGSATIDEVNAADAVIQARRPVGMRSVGTSAASPNVVTINATVNTYLTRAAYLAALATNATQLQRDIQIGEPLYRTRIEALLHSPGSVRNVVLTTPASEPIITDEQIAIVQLGTITVNTLVRP
ncbi:baseplate J/gp47 family protein [Sorangium sp. So ce388]|uniref:baseplate J/gp47 family protein n=1 Tax=Sorangium sp. So ce388 TaxID=3133309 RepID=UPI003F5C4DDF